MRTHRRRRQLARCRSRCYATLPRRRASPRRVYRVGRIVRIGLAVVVSVDREFGEGCRLELHRSFGARVVRARVHPDLPAPTAASDLTTGCSLVARDLDLFPVGWLLRRTASGMCQWGRGLSNGCASTQPRCTDRSRAASTRRGMATSAQIASCVRLGVAERRSESVAATTSRRYRSGLWRVSNKNKIKNSVNPR